MFSSTDTSQAQGEKRMLSAVDEYPSDVEMVLHWMDNDTGIKMIFWNGQVQNLSIPLDQVV